jgi:hypothetical protein
MEPKDNKKGGIFGSPEDFAMFMAQSKVNTKRLAEAAAVMVEMYPVYAKLLKAYYDALIAEGFNPVQALEIVKGTGMFPRT